MSDYPNSRDQKLDKSDSEEFVIGLVACAALLGVLAWLASTCI